jgi:hypothetical protein
LSGPQNSGERILEVRFLIPIREDQDVGSGELHPEIRWEALETVLDNNFDGWRKDAALKRGCYTDPDRSIKVHDDCREYCVAVPESSLDRLRECVRAFGRMFRQKTVYFVVTGEVQFLKGVEEDESIYDA